MTVAKPVSVTASTRTTESRKIGTVSLTLLWLLLLGFALRVFLLDAQSLWWDEGISLHLAESDIMDIFANRLDNIHPPLYFLLLKGWLALSGVTVFSARYLSVLAGWLQVVAAYAIGARWFGRQTGLLAALLMAISAVSVIYAQETRVYSLLPLLYLALLAVTRELIRQSGRSFGQGKTWLTLGFFSWLALHFHYVAFFMVAYVSLWALLTFWRAGRWRDVARLLLVQGAVGVASLPWFGAAVMNWPTIQGEANAGTFVADAVPLDYLLSQVWVFHLTGLAGALGQRAVPALAALTAVVLLLVVVLRLLAPETRRRTLALLSHWLLPLSAALLVWLVRSFSHPRYVVMFVPGLILLAAYIIWPEPRPSAKGMMMKVTRPLTLCLLVLLVAFSSWGLLRYYFDEAAARDNVRAAARYLEEVTDSEDLILIPDTDWSLPYEYRGEARVAMPNLEGDGDFWAALAATVGDSDRVFTLDYTRGTRDWQAAVPFALHAAGYRADEEAIDSLIIRRYDLLGPIRAPVWAPQEANFEGLELTGSWQEAGANAGDALAVALQWQPGPDRVSKSADIALRLMDGENRILSVEDDRLLDRLGRPSDQWPAGEPVVTYHLLPIPAATAPLDDYILSIELYTAGDGALQPLDLLDEQGAPQGQWLALGSVRTERAATKAFARTDPLTDSILPQPVSFDSGLRLLDAALPSANTTAGQPLSVELLWQAAADLPDIRPRLVLQQGDQVVAEAAEAPVDGRYPTSQWQAGEQVRDVRELTIPDGVGEAILAMEVDGEYLVLAEVSLQEMTHQFAAPQMDAPLDVRFGEIARLAGFSVPLTAVDTDGTVPVELLWQSLQTRPAGDYVVFAHLLDSSGRLIAQHDGGPDLGRRPVAGWVVDEYVLDRHDMVFRDVDYAGPARIEVGLYDPQTGQRLKQPDGTDHFILPLTLQVGP